jgi:hypothetical protein
MSRTRSSCPVTGLAGEARRFDLCRGSARLPSRGSGLRFSLGRVGKATFGWLFFFQRRKGLETPRNTRSLRLAEASWVPDGPHEFPISVLLVIGIGLEG